MHVSNTEHSLLWSSCLIVWQDMMATTDSKSAESNISWPPSLIEKLTKYLNLYAGICISSRNRHNTPGHQSIFLTELPFWPVVLDVHRWGRGGQVTMTNADKGEGQGWVDFFRVSCRRPLWIICHEHQSATDRVAIPGTITIHLTLSTLA